MVLYQMKTMYFDVPPLLPFDVLSYPVRNITCKKTFRGSVHVALLCECIILGIPILGMSLRLKTS